MQLREGIRDVIVMPVDLANPVDRPALSDSLSRFALIFRLAPVVDRSGSMNDVAIKIRNTVLKACFSRLPGLCGGRVFMEIQARTKEPCQSIASRSPRNAHPDEPHPPSATPPCIFDVQPLARIGETPCERSRE